MSPKEKAQEIYEIISNELSQHIFNGHHDIAIKLSENQAKAVLKSFNEKNPCSEETKYWESVIDEVRLLA